MPIGKSVQCNWYDDAGCSGEIASNKKGLAESGTSAGRPSRKREGANVQDLGHDRFRSHRQPLVMVHDVPVSTAIADQCHRLVRADGRLS